MRHRASPLGLLGSLLFATAALAAAPAPNALYARGDSLQGSLLATRARYAAWLPAQRAALGAVRLQPWFVRSVARAGADGALPAIDLTAKQADGKPAWTAQAGWKDGGVHPLPRPAGGSSVRLCRTLVAASAVALTVGVGGGDRIALWLNGTRLATAATSLPHGRYGTSYRVDGSHRDQLIVALPLRAGENQLVLEVTRTETSGRVPFQFCFSPSPNAVPRLWERLRHDYPPKDHALLDFALHDWFAPSGWLAATGHTRLEQRLVARAAKEAGDLAAPLLRQLDELTKAKARPNDPRWLALCVRAAETRSLHVAAGRLRSAIGALHEEFRHAYPAAALLQALGEIQAPPGGNEAAWRRVRAQMADLRVRALVRENPHLKGQRLLFVKRTTYDSMHYYDDYYHGVRKFGGNLCVLSLGDGSVREVVPRLGGGVFDRYDLSPDATRLVFGHRAPRPEGYRIWETRLDGTGLRQITFPPADEEERVARYSMYPPTALKSNPTLYGHWTDDMHPCYLPDGRIAFVSSRCERSVLCGGHSLTTTCLYRINADGSGLHQLSQGALSEFTPTLLDDGRILYNRWEYIYKGIAAIQPLWAMRPDGSASEEIYGDNIANPGVFVHARQVPGRPHLVVCSGVGHEPLAVGTILLLDLHRGKLTKEAMQRLTPDTDVRGLRGLYQRRNGQWRANDITGPFYCDPFPLSEHFFLVVCNPDQRYNHPSAYGIYLLDTFGNLVPIHDDPEMSCWQPMLLRPRPTPPVLPPAAPAPVATKEPEATLIVTDVYRGLPGVPRGTVKYLRVMEQIPRPWCVWPSPGDDRFPGQMVAISYYTHIWVAVLHGIVPVHADGSACFTVPADRSIYFQALDDNFMEVQKMRTFLNLQPGETRACIGCHEHRSQPPASRDALALRQPPARPAPQPGDTGPRPLHYPTDVQPIFDKHCVRCHSGAEPKGKLDLSGTLTTHFSRSYEQLIQRGTVSLIQEWTGPRLKNPPPYFTVGGSMAHAPAVPPYTYGSHRSKLITHLRKGHSKVKLSREEFVRLVTWVDANVPFYGSYFGRRHVRYKSSPGFRAQPTLASARGQRPETPRPKPVPATLAAWWRFDAKAGDQVADASGHGHAGKLVAAKRVPGRTGGALRFDGRGYVEVAGLGSFEAASVAAWVKADQLLNTWSPILFTWNWESADFHFSLLRDGKPNLAVNSGGQAIHRQAYASAGDGKWHHVAVVADGRTGGGVTFYVDGHRTGSHDLDAGLPFDLDRLRLGAYNLWERTPGNNFHGTLDDVRVYRGMLTAEQVATLAAGR